MPEAVQIFGLLLHILGRPSHQGQASGGLREFRQWQIGAMREAELLMAEDALLKEYVVDRQNELESVQADFEALMKVVNRKKWKPENNLQLDMMRDLTEAPGLSAKCRETLQKRGPLNRRIDKI